jgi:hypothetical protein
LTIDNFTGGSKLNLFNFELDDLLEPVDKHENTEFRLLWNKYSINDVESNKSNDFKIFAGANAPNIFDENERINVFDMNAFSDAFKTYSFILSENEPGFPYFGEF